jgi:hypothetical protein
MTVSLNKDNEQLLLVTPEYNIDLDGVFADKSQTFRCISPVTEWRITNEDTLRWSAVTTSERQVNCNTRHNNFLLFLLLHRAFL